MSVFIKLFSRTSLTEITGLKAYMRTTPCTDFVNVWTDQNFNFKGCVECIFMSEKHKIHLETFHIFLHVMRSDSDRK